jgi:hypothetical protein
MDRHRALPISGSWSPGVARVIDGAPLLHGPLWVDRNAETEEKGGWNLVGRNIKEPTTTIKTFYSALRYNIQGTMCVTCLAVFVQYASWKLSPQNIKIASVLEVPATCSFFLCVWGVLGLLLTKFHCLKMQTFLLVGI